SVLILVLFYFMYSLLLFLICRGLYSFFADIYLNNVHYCSILLKYIIGFLTYLVGGLLIVGLFFGIILLIDGSINECFVLSIFKVSALPSLLFYHISLLYKKTLNFVK